MPAQAISVSLGDTYTAPVHVDTADPEVRRLIRTIASTVESSGGFIHPDLVFHHDGPHLWVTLPREANPYVHVPLDRPAPDAPPVLEIPDHVHIPIRQADWPDSSITLRYSGDYSGLNDLQRYLLDAMVDLFNACDKVRRVGRSYPLVAAADDPDLLELIHEARPGWGDDSSRNPAQLVLQSRLRSEMGEGDEGPLGFLMPMIDMLNHHPYGSRYESSEDRWIIRAHHPKPDDQIFIRYNKADALGIALSLGYLEEATTFVASVACEVDIPGFGVVEVVGVDVSRRRMPAPRVEPIPQGMRLAGVELGAESAQRLRSLLSLPLRVLRPNLTAPESSQLAESIMARVTEANRSYYRRVAGLPDRLGAEGDLRPLLRDVAGHQLDLLADLGVGRAHEH
jgi:hypothetical protein